MEGDYRTPAHMGEAALEEKRSRFLAMAVPVTTEEEAAASLEMRRKAHRDARHHVYAYCLRGGARRYSDDGEPQGTGGMPLLDILTKEGVTDCLLVVTRYFGGILLGTGGLSRAYSQSGKRALQAAGIVTMHRFDRVEITCDYARYGRVAALVAENDGCAEKTDFTDWVRVVARLPHERTQQLQDQLTEWGAGQLPLERLGSLYAPLANDDAN